ncbi:PVC-type heme-binding CxxCH protein [Roseiconus lacunae]|uniref:FG-GAP-like repeat-containing protein n=1 Tax=Roseiconus lacunae TaxID=2605694 RepID=A0ABT7PK90_9BACT|nr:PVC-type heme-binding CxxCH protein [Roseiconus lacunae]MDM4016904.1 FG-GAP-like repeat-containing protein [Roseiconus lacunae]
MTLRRQRSPRRISLGRSFLALSALGMFLSPPVIFAADSSGWSTKRIHQSFHAEGASRGDIDGDGIADIVAGPLWFRGPDFDQHFELAPPREFPVEVYSDQFFSHVVDVNNDGANDVLVVGFPGQAARLYLNPGPGKLVDGSGDTHWQMSEITGGVDNESPAFCEVVPGGLPEIVCGNQGRYGFFQAGDDATQPWTFHAVTRPGACGGRFAHGLGAGDVDGDGHVDLLDKVYWWKNPGTQKSGTQKSGTQKSTDPKGDQPWQRQIWNTDRLGGGGAQICVVDVDGDNDADLVTSLNAHGWGLAWFEQTEPGQFEYHNIMGQASTENDYGVAFSQLHAVAMADIDGDGRQDIVTGKRWMAHRGKDAGGLQEPVLYWFQNVKTDSGIEFVPRMIDHDSGVGTDVLVADLNDDQRPDIVSCSKRGLAIHTQVDSVTAFVPEKWNLQEGRDQSKYADGYTPKEAAENMMVPDGFEVDLIAAEPELTQPIAMCFDAKGRLWVIEGHTYPTKAPKGQGRDRVVVFSDQDADGSFETKDTFIEGINLASGIEVGFGGVWIGAAPELLFIPDADHDLVPDGEPQVLLDGWGYHDTHETLNSFTWGPDGWLYGCHGVFTHSNVGKPGATDDQRQRLNAGVWRYHPTRHQFEVFAHGTSNPWGVDYNDEGDWFVTACVIPHLFHMIQGARYQRQAGNHFNSFTYDDIKTIADHAHYTGSIASHAFWGDNKRTKPSAPIGTSLLGGGHAHCGLAIYNGGVFPSHYNGKLLFHNLHGHRLVQESVDRNGSGYIGRHRPDFALAKDHLEIGVGVMVGPDGAIYTSDWHDVQTCHNRTDEVWDRTDGRLFRIRYGAVRPIEIDLWAASDEYLVDALVSDNGFIARQAMRVLQERAAAGTLNADHVAKKLRRAFSIASSRRDRLRVLWATHAAGVLGETDLRQMMTHSDEYVRGWAVHFAGETYQTKGTASESSFKFDAEIIQDSSVIVRRYLASILERLPNDRRWDIVETLAKSAIDAHDHNLPLMVWYGLEPLIEDDPARALTIAKSSPLPNLARFAIRRMTTTPQGRDALVDRLAKDNKQGDQLVVLEELNAAAESRAGFKMPQGWPDAFKNLVKSDSPRVGELALSFAMRVGDASVFPRFRAILSDRSVAAEKRLEALASLRTAKDRDLPATLLSLLDDPAVNEKVVAALADFDTESIPAKLLEALPQLSESAKVSAYSTLVSRPRSATQFVAAMESGEVDPATIPAFIIRQAISLGDQSINQRLEKTWGKIAQSSEEMEAEYSKYRAMLKPAAIASASASRGRVLYEANCGKCHKLFGVGGDIGPDITGANRSKLDYLLENILEPNALIGKAYQVRNFLLGDGRVVSGVVKSENDDAVTVQTATEVVIISQDDIEQDKLSNVSLMPSGQLQPMTPGQVRDLFKYLMSPTQVGLPGAMDASSRVVGPAGSIVIEGEMLSDTEVTAGSTRPQPMSGFGKDWSGNEQLWWTGGKVGATLTTELPLATEGSFDIELRLTKAKDYAIIKAELTDSKGKKAIKEIDLYSPNVSLAESVRWKSVVIDGKIPAKLRLTISGANAKAIRSYMCGIDYIMASPQ